MRQTGYLIENLLDKTKYFTTTSSYDRPHWVHQDQASVYETADSAERAMTKLINYGVNMIRIVNLAEIARPLPPMGSELPSEDEMGSELPPEDEMGSELPPEDEMVAANQEEVCADCNHEPCTCAAYDQGDEIDVDSLPPEENEEITNRSTNFNRGNIVSYGGQKFTVVGDMGNGIVQISQCDKPSKLIQVNASELLPIHESANSVGYGIIDAPETKVAVPATVKKGLSDVIKKYSDEVDRFSGTDDARASFAMTVVSAVTELDTLIAHGTVESIKQAQIKYSTYMNVITSLLPPEVIKFITYGGRAQSLKERFYLNKKGIA